MSQYVLDQHQPVPASTVQIFDCETYVLMTGPDAPGKIAAHLIFYMDLEVDDGTMVLTHVPGETAYDVMARLSDPNNEFRPSMSNEMRAKRDQFLRDIEGPMDA